MGGERVENTPEGKMEPCTESTCDQCETVFVPKNRNRLKVRFCKPKCSSDWHNGQRLKGAAILKAKTTAVQRPKKRPIRTLDELVAAEGLPSGCYPPGALGLLGRKRSGIDNVPPADRPALLVEAARRLGLTEEGPTVKAARLAAKSAEPSAFSLQPSEAQA